MHCVFSPGYLRNTSCKKSATNVLSFFFSFNKDINNTKRLYCPSLSDLYGLMTWSSCNIYLLLYDVCQPGIYLPRRAAYNECWSKGVQKHSSAASQLFIAFRLFRSWLKQNIDTAPEYRHSQGLCALLGCFFFFFFFWMNRLDTALAYCRPPLFKDVTTLNCPISKSQDSPFT